jgi:hypothetical protein
MLVRARCWAFVLGNPSKLTAPATFANVLHGTARIGALDLYPPLEDIIYYFATLPSNLFSPIDSHILDFEILSENHNFILIKQIIFCYTKIRLHYFNKQFNKNLKVKCARQLFCSTLPEFENFLLRERILINVTTCQNETSS